MIYYVFLTLFVLITIYSYIRWKVEIYQPIYILLYGLLLTILRLSRGGFKLMQRVRPPEISLPRYLMPSSVTEYVAAYNLKPMEVILGYEGRRPVKVQVNKAHTLIGATSGGGKSVSIHSILVQLFTNPAFKGRVFLLDMKSHPKDRLELWESLVEAYVQRDYDGGVSAAITTLGFIEQTLREPQDVPFIVIVDEVYPLTQNKLGDTILGTIASQLRLNGSLIVTVQHAHHQVLKTFTKHNIERRLCGVVVNESQAQTILEVRPGIKLPIKPGEFILREPGRPGLISLVAQEVEPEEVEAAVGMILERKTEEDWRLKLYRDVTENKKPGDKVAGVRTIKEGDYGLVNAQEKVMIAYRNFANAGIFNEPKKGQSYTVALPYPKGVSTLLNMEWKENPDAVVQPSS